jgi:prepilin-type N-terminal cleavage/methylation domain-containing protein
MRRREEGFTLIEVAVALGLFGIVLVSLSLLFDRALATSTEARVDQIAKTLAQEKLEEVRSFPLYISQREEAGDVDVLDRWFVDADGVNDVTPTGAAGVYDGTANVWSYTSSETIDRPDSQPFTRRVVVQFVKTATDGTLGAVAPVAGYDSDALDVDQPSTETVKVTVDVSWGSGESLTLNTVMAASSQEAPSVEATGSFVGAQATGVAYRDGDDVGQTADLLAIVTQGRVAFREVTSASSQASGDPVQIVERDPQTNAPLQPEGPTAGQSSATAPNSTDGSVQTDSQSLSGGSISSVNLPTTTVASWGGSLPSASTEARVSGSHTLTPQARTTVTAADVHLFSRQQGENGEHPVLDTGTVTGTAQQTSSTSQAQVTVSVDLLPLNGRPGAAIWSAPQWEDEDGFEGVVTVESLSVDLTATASGSTSSSAVDWTVEGLRVWDPDLAGGVGAYSIPHTFGFRTDCGGWVIDPNLCGTLRTDGKAPFENPNPVIIPDSYAGTDAQGNPATSLTIVAGVTVRDAAADAAQEFASASAAQKNILAISTRDDIEGAVRLEPMLVGLGDANASVSYISHEH